MYLVTFTSEYCLITYSVGVNTKNLLTMESSINSDFTEDVQTLDISSACIQSRFTSENCLIIYITGVTITNLLTPSVMLWSQVLILTLQRNTFAVHLAGQDYPTFRSFFSPNIPLSKTPHNCYHNTKTELNLPT